MKTAYWPVACDLDVSNIGGRIIVGPETRCACIGVIEHIERTQTNKASDDFSSNDYVILPSAGVPDDKKWGDITMSHVMRDYFLELGVLPEYLCPLKAKKFNTQGEAEVVVKYLQQNREIKKLVISVKWWHSLRAYNWILLYLKKAEIYDVIIEVEPNKSQVDPTVVQKEFWWAYPFNLFRMWGVRVFG